MNGSVSAGFSLPFRLRRAMMCFYPKSPYDLEDYSYDNAIRQLHEHPAIDCPRLTFLDVGARGGIHNQVKSLHDLGKLNLIGVEPDKQECKRLREEFPEYSFHVVGLSDTKKEQTLHITANPGCSSLYEPNSELLERFPFIKDWFIVEQSISVDSTTLDEFTSQFNYKPDLLKLDTQGSEADIFSEGEKTLDGMIALEFETHFKPLYRGQAMFPEISQQLESHGFDIIDMNYELWTRTGKVYNERSSRATHTVHDTEAKSTDGELIEADVLFMDISKPPSKEVAYKKIIAALLYRKKSIAQQMIIESVDVLGETKSEVTKIIEGI